MGEGEILEAEAGNGAGSLEGSVPYRQALPEYREAAVEAAQDADLPAYARQWVETYFKRLRNDKEDTGHDSTGADQVLF